VPTIVLSCSRDPGAERHVVFALRQSGWRGDIEIVRPWSRPARIGASALLLAGGLDVEPHRWHRGDGPVQHGPLDPERDAIEIALVTAAWARGLPIFGICRGAQLMAVSRGGSLHDDIATASGREHDAHQHGSADDPCVRHRVQLRPRSRLAAMLGANTAWVNSRHHQAVREPGDGLVAVAHEPETAMPDGALIEAIEASDHARWALGVQWHPENLVRRADRAGAAARSLFSRFVAAARVASTRCHGASGAVHGVRPRPRRMLLELRTPATLHE
jgi:putative glutamine amidotransferase